LHSSIRFTRWSVCVCVCLCVTTKIFVFKR
jgi:hypothetical protein